MRRILRATDKEPVIQALTSGETGLFKEIWKLLLFAAMVGYHDGTREPLKKSDSGKAIDSQVFGNCPAWPGILYLMGLVETQDTRSLYADDKNENDLIKRFEEYANRGLTILHSESEAGNYSVQSISRLILEIHAPDTGSTDLAKLKL